ncbi:2-heptyl-3-hydroxy-4(1H)-quinolone synthase [Acaryochloris thomasi RCC1774]|uniref:2-heptyl-3-hydroxy-4(1H)-quinolone synthase n=1 Tax=Acaryochloris thomasi RCC1774 TaxID=1764569 RepID=A0A2W1JJN4_9CYAN|nr:FAD-dependent monooxygenase [Acaryochloris thomasi]PZD71262.1 2-heptyl-3-hydroxy-4(1H)-quinolone synthase [Acaryochloris thomasi RCC1774]
MAEVVIVGAGPTGATLALLLTRQGIPVTLIEAAKDFKRVFRGEGLMPSGLDALEQMDLSEVLNQIPTRPLTGWEFIIDQNQLFRVEEPMGADQPCTLVSQPPFLEALIAEAQRYTTFEFIQGIPVKDLRRRSPVEGEEIEHPQITGVTLADGREISAALVVGADGRNSIVRQRAGLQLVSQPNDINILWFKLPAHPRFIEDNVFCSILNAGSVFSIFHGAEAGKLHLAWVLSADDKIDRQNQDWAETFASLSPAWLATHFRGCANQVEPPIRLTVVVGRCPSWHQTGILLLGDAAHPMSPVRAQGINLALRDVIVAANYLVPQLKAEKSLDSVLPKIQAEREPEIIRAQHLQKQEARQGELLKSNGVLRSLLHQFAPLIRPAARYSWIKRQQQMRQGVTQVKLAI